MNEIYRLTEISFFLLLTQLLLISSLTDSMFSLDFIANFFEKEVYEAGD